MNFKVTWYDEYDIGHISKVYAVDTTRDRFLVVDSHGYFIWVDTNLCKIEEDSHE